ncbi:MAG: zeta toxin family protein [Proteobacteria bacterium]|nr:zeta toxin family protein [Pseudomonadota bacterium]
MKMLRSFLYLSLQFFLIPSLLASPEADRVRELLSRGPGTREIYQGEARKNLLPVGEEYVDRPWHGYYSDDRHAFQKTIIDQYLAHLHPSSNPEVILTAGAFGSGKTRILGELFAQGWIQREEFLVINMDHFRNMIPEYLLLVDLMKNEPKVYEAIAAEFHLKDPGSFVQIEVGYLQEMLLWQALERGVNIIIDGSMANKEYFERFLNAMRTRFNKYQSVGVIHADAGDKTVERAVRRGLENSRVINPDLVKKSIAEVTATFAALKSKFDFYVEVDNSGDRPTIRAVGAGLRGERLDGLQIPLLDTHRDWRGRGSDFDRILNGRLRRSQSYYDIVFDIDWTLFYVLKDAVAGSVDFEGQHFMPYRGLDRFFKVLIEMIPNLRIHFMSGASEARIKKFLSEIKLDSVKPILDLTYTVVGVEGLHKREASETAQKFTDIYAKSFYSLTPLAHPDRSILLDDQPDFALAPLRAANSLGNYAHFLSFEEAQKSGSKYAPKSYLEWELDRDRLALIIAVIEEAYRRDRAGTEAFSTAIQSLLGDKGTGEELSKKITDPSFAPYFDRGREMLGFNEESGFCSGALNAN